MKYRPKHIAEFVMLVLLTDLIRILPLHAALSLGWCFAACTHFIGRIQVKRTRSRIRQVFGDQLPESEVRRIAWISWRNLCFNGIEALRFSRLTPEKIRKQPLADLEPKLKRILKESETGFIIATPHMGNWELAGITADLAGIPLFVIVRDQKNPLVNNYINRMRRSFSMEVLHRKAQMWKGVVDRIRQGKVLAILPDISIRANGVSVDFLNGTAMIAAGTAHFAELAACAVYPVVVRRKGWTKHEAVLFNPVSSDPDMDRKQDQHRMMQEIMTVFSEEIKKTPEQYFWYNKRWVLSPNS